MKSHITEPVIHITRKNVGGLFSRNITIPYPDYLSAAFLNRIFIQK